MKVWLLLKNSERHIYNKAFKQMVQVYTINKLEFTQQQKIESGIAYIKKN